MKIEEFIKKSKAIKLSSRQKTQMREKILLYIKNNPEIKTDLIRHKKTEVTTASWSKLFLNYKFNYSYIMPIAIIIAVIFGGGVSFAAENSLPGDTLYPIKTGINEEVRGWIALSDEAEAKWQYRLAERRLEEAEEIAVNSELKEEVRLNIENNFEKHNEKIELLIAELESKDKLNAAVDLNSRLESSLKAHEQILLKLGQESDDENEEEQVNSVAAKVRLKISKAAKRRSEIEAKTSAETSINPNIKEATAGAMTAAENKLQEVKTFIEESKNRVNENVSAKAEAKFNSAIEVMAEANTEMEEEHYGEAFNLYHKASRLAQEAKLIVEASRNMNLEININGNHDDANEDETKEQDEENKDGNYDANGSINIELSL
ncbi:MAG: hypothetical protein COV29_00780 [Candidatus Yanofskybacteria bacterium CG10_big_fil_rev_8_21_14_0_10_36_16]|uniref:DUF5667 domain-containing protein n=1 Tax=Candidatus Yanofskybacteria bacterium CG10_big_fil_rev_8_21_14_0_10_36_16 TaxID=1975096 RepID=A0A2J0Q831_9BACT|nr:MAG: hypothetical protein COV29_00780 [Candidatus Yanofskybacteria bacterium CG10_big_fil_rev_8_21_14_0_10_36_16]